ncbi:hypothetical protein HYALB_00010363 [Hymenoscyphus albidus]|uniref:DNA/RNA-binding protein Alba-like domain-containing protein n=1 Tax=Hymenoscyphus albidus TaxID=595503 RepID=A0A9N9LMS7_9HELO|nr:hypothetical protein HYALB_00010363 [Hymenoscyphus albidus]
MARTKKTKAGSSQRSLLEDAYGGNQKKRKREGKEQDSIITDADESSEIQIPKRTKTIDEEDSRDEGTTYPSISTVYTEPHSFEEVPTKGPASIVSGNAPPVFGDLAKSHDVLFMSTISSSKIEKKTTAVLKHLARYPTISPAKPALVLAHSKADTASKLITIIEIAKRDIASKEGKWFQYNMVYQITELKKEKKDGIKSNGGTSSKGDGDEKEEDEDEETFETMKTPFERSILEKPKVRAIPHLAIYLSRIRIEGLRKKYGEQTNAVEVPGDTEWPRR